MLTSDLVSPPAIALSVLVRESTDQRSAAATVVCFSLPGSYSSSFFHIRKTIAAIRRAIVSLPDWASSPLMSVARNARTRGRWSAS